MAKKKNTNSTSTTDVTKFCAFWGLVIAAIAAIITFIFGLLARLGVSISWAGRVTGLCNTISQIALLVAVIIPAYKYSKSKTAVWRAFFWVAVIFIVLGLIGLNLAF